MMNVMQGCSGWLMAAGGFVTYGTLILVAVASSKYLANGRCGTSLTGNATPRSGVSE